MTSLLFKQPALKNKRHSGSSIVLVLFAISLLVLEISVMGLSLSRSLGSEGVLLTQNLAARRGLETAFTRLENSLYSYLTTGTQTAADTLFASGGGSAISNATVTATNPETAATDNTPVTISAWVQSRRGSYYNIRATAVSGDVSLTGNRWIQMSPCSASGSLTTILSGRPYPFGALDAENDTVYIRESNNPGNLYRWSPSTGLSTLMANLSKASGTNTSLWYDPFYPRLYFDDEYTVYVYTPSTGVISSLPADGPARNLRVDKITGRVFYSGNNRAFTWHPSTGTSTILTTGISGRGMIVDPTSGRAFFGTNGYGDSLGNMYTWSSTTGLSTLYANSATKGSDGLLVDPTSGRVFIGSAATSGLPLTNFYTWTTSTGLSTLLVNTASNGRSSMAVDPLTGRVFWGGAPISGNNNFYSWHSSTGLSTVMANISGSPQSTMVDPTTGRFFFTSYYNGPLLTWLPTTGLSTIAPSSKVLWAGYQAGTNLVINRVNGRIYFTSGAGRLLTWHSSTGLSTLALVSKDFLMEVDPYTERLYVGTHDNYDNTQTNSIYTWSLSTGLSTLATALYDVSGAGPGECTSTYCAELSRGFHLYESRPLVDNINKRTYFNEEASSGNFYVYTAPERCSQKPY